MPEVACEKGGKPMKIMSVGVGGGDHFDQIETPIIVLEIAGTLDDLRRIGGLLYEEVTIAPVLQSGPAPEEK